MGVVPPLGAGSVGSSSALLLSLSIAASEGKKLSMSPATLPLALSLPILEIMASSSSLIFWMIASNWSSLGVRLLTLIQACGQQDDRRTQNVMGPPMSCATPIQRARYFSLVSGCSTSTGSYHPNYNAFEILATEPCTRTMGTSPSRMRLLCAVRQQISAACSPRKHQRRCGERVLVLKRRMSLLSSLMHRSARFCHGL